MKDLLNKVTEAKKSAEANLYQAVYRVGLRFTLDSRSHRLHSPDVKRKPTLRILWAACREETAAMRSQANTAKLLQDNPTLMRLRELEALEKVAATAKLNVLLGDKGLTDKVVNVM
jgi:hypothetical protein